MAIKDKQPKVTVLCTVFNGERYFDRAIPSILKQTYDNFDFLIINDGSTDKTLELLQEIIKTDSRIKLINSERIGRTKALNLGIEYAKTSFIAIQDFDDISYPERLEKQVAFMLENEDISWLGTAGKCVTVLRNESRINYFPLKHNDIIKYMAQSIPYDHTTIMFRKMDVLKVGGYSDEEGGIEDFWLSIRLAQHGFKLANVNQVLGEHLEHPDSFWNSKYSYMQRQREIQKAQIYAIKEFNMPFWLYIFPLGRFFYGYLPTSIKKILRILSGSKEEIN